MYKGNVLETLRTSESERYSRFIEHKTEKIKTETNFLKRNTYLTKRGFISGNSGPGMILFLAGRFTITHVEKVALLTQASHCLLSFDLAAYPFLQL